MGINAMGDADARYRRLIDRSGLGLFHTDRSGKIVWVNDAAARIVGFSSAVEFMAEVKNIRSIYVDPSRRDIFEEEVAASGSVSDFEYEIKRPDGTQRWISVSATSIAGAHDGEEGYEGVVLDVTDRKLLEAAVSAMSSDLEPTEAVSKFADVVRRVVPFTQLSLAVIEGDGYRRIVSISGDSNLEAFPRDEPVPLADNSVGHVVATKSPLVVQDTGEGRWGFDRVLADRGVGSYAIFPLIADDAVFATFNIGTSGANSLPQEAVSLLAKHTAAVAHAVKNMLMFERQRGLVDSLRELDRLKNEFFAGVSHDLRNPLSVVSGLAEILVSDWDLLSPERRREMTRVISRNVRILNELLERDLDVALIESGELQYEIAPMYVGTIVAETTEAFRDSHPQHHFELAIADGLPQGLGDARRHIQILQNLLSNAVKYSPQGSTIKVSVEIDNDELVVAVADEGPGIKEEQIPQLFHRLSRLERSKPGTGLGLYISKSMVEAQGGRVWVESPPGGGARFAYTVPVSAGST